MDAHLLLSPEDRALIDELKAELRENRKPVPDVLVSNNEAARILGLRSGYVSFLLRNNRLKRITIGESTGIRLSEVLEYKYRR